MNQPINDVEQSTLEWWNKEQIFARSLRERPEKDPFIFYDGPPFATGLPHYGHIVASLIKDVIPRYQTMRGKRVDRRWGWDCHGLPIENIVEKELGVKHKKDIEEKIGVDVFNEACRKDVLQYADAWGQIIPRVGRWVDMSSPYRTMDRDYMESIWWVFKSLWDKGLLYEGYKSMHVCPRCETTLSQSEVTEGYKEITDLSATVTFPLENDPTVAFLAWTTTPWTLPGNAALAVNAGLDYVTVEMGDKKYILAAETAKRVLADKEYKVLKTEKGSALVGLKYLPLFDYFATEANKEKGFAVYAADFVSAEEGTGIVHIAPAFGEDDMNLGQEKGLPFIQHVGMDGLFSTAVTDWAGESVKAKDDPQVTDKKVVEYLAGHDRLFSTAEYAHSYPHCYRCETPLLNYATSSWFVNVTQLKPRMLELVKEIEWVPAHIKEGRFGQWLVGARDWSISRQRYWGSVLPIWQCEACGERKVFGSIADLAADANQEVTDLHKHVVDKITVPCSCGGEMRRIPDVLDCWFESGSMPYAQQHYPFENKELFEANFPAQFIAEGADQCRAWFYYLVVLSVALFDSVPFKNVIVNGIVLAQDGKKMSKRLKNYPDPMVVVEKYGADALRYYLLSSPVMRAETVNFSEAGVSEIAKKLVAILDNVVSFYQLYADDQPARADSTDLLDRWVLARLTTVSTEVTAALDSYDLVRASRPLLGLVDDLSTWYVRRSRDRFKVGDESAIATLRYVLQQMAKLLAPFTPFLAERVWQVVKEQAAADSVHLELWPAELEAVETDSIIMAMTTVRQIVEAGHALRQQTGFKVRQPLSKLYVDLPADAPKVDQLLEIVANELNVKEVVLGAVPDLKKDSVLAEEGKKPWVGLDTTITKELQHEADLRELGRALQNARKQARLQPGQAAQAEISSTTCFTDEELNTLCASLHLTLAGRNPAEGITVKLADKSEMVVHVVAL